MDENGSLTLTGDTGTMWLWMPRGMVLGACGIMLGGGDMVGWVCRDATLGNWGPAVGMQFDWMLLLLAR